MKPTHKVIILIAALCTLYPITWVLFRVSRMKCSIDVWIERAIFEQDLRKEK